MNNQDYHDWSDDHINNDLPYNETGVITYSGGFMFRVACVLVVSCSFLCACLKSRMCSGDHNANTTPPYQNNLQEYLLSNQETGIKIDDTCSICIEPFSPRNTTLTLDCNHIFHSECIVVWFEKELSCPLCRQKLNIE